MRSDGSWTVYLAGEIHTDWRDRIRSAAAERGLPVVFTGPITDHPRSDGCGEAILGPEAEAFWKDHKAAKLNAIRTRTLLGEADVVVVRFGDKYKQWNAAFDAGFAAALGKPLIVVHDPGVTHALKEVDAAALAVCTEPAQVAEILAHVLSE